MSAEQLATRMLAERSGVSSSNIRKGDIHEDEYGRLVAAARDLNDAPLFIDHTGAIPIATLAARARRLKRQRGLGLIVVDYLQLVRASNTRGNDGRVQEVSEITQGLKALQRAERAGSGTGAIIASGGDTRRQAPPAGRFARVRFD